MSYPAPFPAPPQVQDYGGPVLQQPKLVPVFFSNDDATTVAQLSDFASRVGSTQYWAATTSEYGVGPATALAPVQLTEAAPASIDDAAIQTWLAGKLNGNDPAWPANDGNTVYVLFYPDATTVTLQGLSSCQGFGGYHQNITLDTAHGSADAAYVVVPRCLNFPPNTGVDAVTASTSHELIEAATDPYPLTQPAYALMDDAHIFWLRVLGGGEVGDMCAQFDSSFTTFSELAYSVQRTWSNAAALAGHDPCVPALPGEVYFNAAPELSDTVAYTVLGQVVNVPGVSIPVGQSKTIDLDLFSEAATSGPWTVSVEDASVVFGGAQHLTLGLNNTTGQNGDKLQLSITVTAAGSHNTEIFIVKSTLNGQSTVWFGLVGN
ncbi:MAG: hypothetical protein JST54_21125 [Deltaproteobacteria bacterium]|nr:hypothetical protein [Deltaproteobacteria bacterium]